MAFLEHCKDKNIIHRSVYLTKNFFLLEELFSCEKNPLKKYCCKDCEYRTDFLIFLKRHAEVHITNLNLKLQRFVCKIYKFETHSSLHNLKHQQNCSQKSQFCKQFICPYCLYCTKTKKYFTNHMKLNHDSSKWFQCDQCLYKTLIKQRLEQHKKKHLNNKLLKCKNCPFATKNQSSLRTHEFWIHSDVKPTQWFQCDQCPFTTRTKGCLKVHTKAKHAQIEWFNCDHCPFKFRQKPYLKLHVLRRHTPSDSVNWFQCDQCPFRDVSTHFVRTHIRLKHQSDCQWLQCEECLFHTKLREHLQKHLIKQHTEPKILFKCEQCSFFTTQERYLKSHRRNQHLAWEKIRWYHCARCLYKTKIRAHLKKHEICTHVRTRRDDVKWFKCDKCAYRTKRQQLLKDHLIGRHEIKLSINEFKIRIKQEVYDQDQDGKDRKKCYQCCHCLYETVKRADLNDHMLVRHTPLDAIKWFHCDQCQFKAKCKTYLCRHKRNMHNN